MLSSLPESWDTIVSAVSSARGSNALKYDEIYDVILSKSIHKKDSGESSRSSLNVRGRGKQRGQSKNRGRSNSKRRGRFQNPRESVCWDCGDKGRFKRNYPKSKNKRRSNNHIDDNDSANSAEDMGAAHILSVDSPIESWIIDSGAWFRSSPSKELFHNFVGGKFDKVYIADNKSLKILRRGDVNVKTLNGATWKLQDVWYIP